MAWTNARNSGRSKVKWRLGTSVDKPSKYKDAAQMAVTKEHWRKVDQSNLVMKIAASIYGHLQSSRSPTFGPNSMGI